ncbi:NmrA domain-containing protein [Mycena sanguinolenta]|uniref:NmrA domain-containing protein n=1 Tax=Mycena sanguinolenta TaxID=230812 RepID=A0A8H6Z2I4_9AGAR|nr:NmrA domain-containing protein [Mycena sanguinolenta]
MTITQANSAPLIAVVGATGAQGRSVIKALAESDKPYRIRGFTRDVTKAAAEELKKQGVEMVAVNLVVENKENVYRAFVGADYAFLLTNFWEHANKEKEISEGKLLIDAAKAAGVKGIIWSGLVAVSKISGGKHPYVDHFDGKADITEYGRASGVPFVDVQAGLYATNFLANPSMLGKQPDGTYAIAWAIRPDTVLPIIDIEHDYGLYVRRVLEQPVFPDGEAVYTTSENITVAEMARQLAETTGKTVVYKQISVEEWTRSFAAMGMPPKISNEIIDGFFFFDEFGYYGGQPTASKEGLGKKTRTWAEFVKDADWRKAFV